MADKCIISLNQDDDLKLKTYCLYFDLEGLVNEWRNKDDFNIREIDFTLREKMPQEFELLKRMQVENLVGRIKNGKKIDEDNPISDEDIELFAILAIAFSGFVAARLDGNFKDMGIMYKWCDKATDERIKEHPICKAAYCYYRFGACREEVSGNLQDMDRPSEKDLKDILFQAEKECESAKDQKIYVKKLRLFLVDAVMQLPLYRQKQLRYYFDWLDIKNFEEPRTARENYNLSKVFYAKDELDHAIKCSVRALQKANPSDLNFIELCRQNLLILEQEKIARETTKKEALKEAQEEFNSMIQKQKEEIIEPLTRDLQLRVIEILGIFLAVTGVGVTAVGGIAVSGGFWDRLGIYLGGGLSIIVLFGFLKFVVIDPSIKRGKDDTKRGKDDTPDTQSGKKD